jgi:predicted enzyme related to lactoylglutathione lyase
VANTVEETEMPPIGKYQIFKVGDHAVGGGMDMTAMVPAEIPPHWLIYFNASACSRVCVDPVPGPAAVA